MTTAERRRVIAWAARDLDDITIDANISAKATDALGDLELMRLWLEHTQLLGRIVDRLTVLNLEANERMVVS